MQTDDRVTELLVSLTYQVEALIRLMEKKGVSTRADVLNEIQEVIDEQRARRGEKEE